MSNHTTPSDNSDAQDESTEHELQTDGGASRRAFLAAAAALSTLTVSGGTATADADSSDDGDEIDADHLPSSDLVDEDVAPIGDLTSSIEDAGFADLQISGGSADDVDVSIIPVREPATPQDVTIGFSIGDFGSVQLSLAEDDVNALCDQLQQALEVPKFDE